MFVVLDCGHNFSDTYQKFSPIKSDGKRFYEYESNRKIGLLVADKLMKLGIKHCWTIQPDDKNDMSLANRVGIANSMAYKYGKNNVLFISIHSDALGMGDKWYDANGYSIFTSVGDTKSDKYAKVFEEVAKEKLEPCKKKVRGLYEKNFYVLRKTICPAILLEQLFYTNKEDLEFLESDEGRNILADIIVESIQKINGAAN